MDATAIEELNKVRKAMGLKPLPVPNAAPALPKETPKEEEEEVASTVDTRQAQATDNFKKLRDAEKAKKDREERAAVIKKERDRAQRYAILEGKGLGDIDDDGNLDTKSWLKSQRKRQKKIAKVRAQEEEEESEAAAKAAEYSSKDLAGVKVAHEMSTLLDGDEQILTLKDNGVLDDDEEGDELENQNLREQEQLEERLHLKKKRSVYDPNDIDETGGHSILAQYDEEISGKKKKAFTLDAQGSLGELSDILDGPIEKKKMQNLDTDIMDTTPASDYLDASEIKVKKPKKKSKSTRQRPINDEDTLFPVGQSVVPEELMDIDAGSISYTKKRKITDDNFVDDDDLQASLALQRRSALKTRKRIKAEDLAKQFKAEAAADAENEEMSNDQGGLVLDETTEFLSAIKKPSQDEESERPRKKNKSVEPVTAMEAEPSEDEEMENAPAIKEESVDEEAADLTTTGVDQEKFVAQGMGATLALLKERNIIDGNQGAELNDQYRKKQLFLAEQARLIAKIDEDAKRQRERDRASGYLDRLSARDREEYARKQNTDREFKLSSIRATLLKKHEFSVDIKYLDENGRRLNQKEAFRELSHQFHGKTSGAGKIDKAKSKIDQEQRRLAHSIFDASQDAGMSSATAQQTKKRKEAGVRLA